MRWPFFGWRKTTLHLPLNNTTKRRSHRFPKTHNKHQSDYRTESLTPDNHPLPSSPNLNCVSLVFQQPQISDPLAGDSRRLCSATTPWTTTRHNGQSLYCDLIPGFSIEFLNASSSLSAFQRSHLHSIPLRRISKAIFNHNHGVIAAAQLATARRACAFCSQGRWKD